MPAEVRAGYVPAAALPAAGGSRQRTVEMDPLVEAAAEERELKYCEMVLINAFEAVLHVGLEHLTPLCKEARISKEKIEKHADEIGVHETLSREQISGLRKFVQFMTLTEKLQIVKLEGEMPGRSVLGYQAISIAKQAEWQAVVEATCGLGKYFRAKSTVYETMLKFGYKGQRNSKLPADAADVKKKDRVLLYSERFTFDEHKMHGNLQRYTNSHMKMYHAAEARDGLSMLLAAAHEDRSGT